MFLQWIFTLYLSSVLPNVASAIKGPSAAATTLAQHSTRQQEHQQHHRSSTCNEFATSTMISEEQQQPIPFLPLIFGVSKILPLHIPRGGEVLEPTTHDAVEAILIKAGSENKLIVIDFSASWCGPCKMIAPLFQELSESHDDVVFIKIDVDENPETAAKYGVSAMPTFVFVKGGEVVDRLMGANPTRLQELINEHK